MFVSVVIALASLAFVNAYPSGAGLCDVPSDISLIGGMTSIITQTTADEEVPKVNLRVDTSDNEKGIYSIFIEPEDGAILRGFLADARSLDESAVGEWYYDYTLSNACKTGRSVPSITHERALTASDDLKLIWYNTNPTEAGSEIVIEALALICKTEDCAKESLRFVRVETSVQLSSAAYVDPTRVPTIGTATDQPYTTAISRTTYPTKGPTTTFVSCERRLDSCSDNFSACRQQLNFYSCKCLGEYDDCTSSTLDLPVCHNVDTSVYERKFADICHTFADQGCACNTADPPIPAYCADDLSNCGTSFGECASNAGSDPDSVCGCLQTYNTCVRKNLYNDECHFPDDLTKSYDDALSQACSAYDQAYGCECNADKWDPPASSGMSPTGIAAIVIFVFSACCGAVLLFFTLSLKNVPVVEI